MTTQIGGEVVPYSLARIPKAGETRGNLAVGGKGVALPLSARDLEIAAALGLDYNTVRSRLSRGKAALLSACREVFAP